MEFEIDDDHFAEALLNMDLPDSKESSGSDLYSTRMLVQGSDAWFAARKNRLTASNFGTAAGLSKYFCCVTLMMMLFPLTSE